jgi:hypothetical protein
MGSQQQPGHGQLLWEKNSQLPQQTWNVPKRMLLDIGHIVVGDLLLLLVVVVFVVAHGLRNSDFDAVVVVVVVN